MGPCPARFKGRTAWVVSRRSIYFAECKRLRRLHYPQVARCLGNQHPGIPHHLCEPAIVVSDRHRYGAMRTACAWGVNLQGLDLQERMS